VALASLGSIGFEGTVYRHVSLDRECTSGTGLRESGARWNPPNGFPVVYTALSIQTVADEFFRFAQKHSLPIESLLPRSVCVIEAHLEAVLDLRTVEAFTAVGLVEEDIYGDDWTSCQVVGAAAHHLDLEGILAPSATGHGEILAVFENQLVKANSRMLTIQRDTWTAPPPRGLSK